MNRQFRAIVRGTVQGVCFRARTRERADALDLCGTVRNLPDGSVEVIARGAADTLDEFITYLHHGPPGAEVRGVELDWGDQTSLEADFRIVY